MKRTLIIGKDAFLVTTMRMALKFASDVTVVGVRDVGSGMRRALRESTPDIVLLDGSDDAERTIERVTAVAEERPEALVLVLGGRPDGELLDQLLDAGVTVCLSRALTASRFDALLSDDGDANTVAPATRQPAVAEAPAPAPVVPAGRAPLTNRELEILRCVAEGHTNARIARDLWVTEQTVKFHLTNIYRKLGVRNRTEASRHVLLNENRAPAQAPATATAINGHDLNGRADGQRYGALEAVR